MVSKDTLAAIADYDRFVKKKGVDETVLKYYLMALNTVFFYDKDPEYGLELSKRVKTNINTYCTKMMGVDVWEAEKASFERRQKYEPVEQFYEVLKVEAQHKNVDSYFLYLEKDREPKDRFYLPKRRHFLRFGITRAFQGLLDDKYDIVTISLPPGTAKGQAMDAKILTPSGYITMGDVRIGTKVIAGNGNIAEVDGIYPQGKRDMYRFTFDDGSTCEVSDNHLWRTQTRDDRVRGDKYRVVETLSMIKNYRVERDKRCNYSVDYVQKIDFTQSNLPLHPYLVGIILGDGCFSSGNDMITIPDDEVRGRVSDMLPAGYSLKRKGKYDYRVKGHYVLRGKKKSAFSSIMRYLGLYKKKSYEKHIPKMYLYATYENRLELLRGLMDSDGCATKTCASYSTTSEQLAIDITELVHSLGGYASISKHNAKYKKNDGTYIKCRDYYKITIQFSASQPNPFWLKRKADKYNPKRSILKRFITNIEYIGKKECQCIHITDPCHLYITDNYIITHNTTALKFFHSGVIGWFPKDYSLFYSHSSDITRMYFDGVLQIVSDNQEYRWNTIFPDLKISGTNAKMQQFNVGSYKAFPSLQCTSVGSESAGKVRASKFLLVDDMIGKLEEALNKNTLEKLWGAYSVDARQRKTVDSDGHPCKEIHCATRWSTIDIIGKLRTIYENNDRFISIAVPDIDKETGESNFDYEYGGFSAEYFNDISLTMDDISYRCLYKQEPIEREGLLYHEEDIRRFASLPINDDGTQKEPDAVLGVCDTKTTGTDYMVMPVIYQYEDEYYCVDCVCSNSTNIDALESRMANMIAEHKMQMLEVESNAGGAVIASNIEKKVSEIGWSCNITTKATETNKQTRIIVNADWIKKHVLFREHGNYAPKDDYGELMNQLLSYSISGKNAHDDVCDCMANLSLFVNRKFKRREVMIIKGGLL